MALPCDPQQGGPVSPPLANPWGEKIDLHFVLDKNDSTTAKIAVASDSPAKPAVSTILINADDPRFGKVTPEQISRLKLLYLADQLVLMEALAHDIQTGQGSAAVFKPQHLKAILTNIQDARKSIAFFTFEPLRPSPTFVGSGEYQKGEIP